MFQIDSTFLEDIGVAELPDERQRQLVEQIQQELNVRFGERLAQMVDEDAMVEFTDITDETTDAASAFLSQHMPQYRQAAEFLQLAHVADVPAGDAGIVREFAAAQWLKMHCPNYQAVASEIANELKQELINHQKAVLGR